MQINFFFRFEKKKRQNNWFIKAANEMDIELDDRHLYPIFKSEKNNTSGVGFIKNLGLILILTIYLSLNFFCEIDF